MADTKSILEYVKNAEVLQYARRLNPEIFFGLQLFRPRTVSELNYQYLKEVGGTKASMMAELVAWEAAAPLAPHEMLARVEGELPPIKTKRRFSEQEIIRIFGPRSTAERREAITRLYRDVQSVVDGVHSRLNWIIMQSLAYGEVEFTGGGVKLAVDWGLDGSQIVEKTSTEQWDDLDDSNPVADIQALQKVVLDATGVLPDAAITSNTVISYLLQNENIKKAMFGSTETSRILTIDALNNFFVSIGLPELYSYDERVKIVDPTDYKSVTTERYYPETRFTMFPRGEVLGETLYGPTAEGIRALALEEAPGIFAEVFETRDPVNVFTYAVATAFMTFPGVDEIGILVPVVEE
jgi:hypothetical protein